MRSGPIRYKRNDIVPAGRIGGNGVARLVRIACLLLAGALLFACRAKTPEPSSDAYRRYESDGLKIGIRRVEDAEAHQIYYVADIRLSDIRFFRAGFANGAFDAGVEDAEAFSRRENAVLAVNGSFNTGLVIHDGLLYQQPDDRHDAILLLYRDGSMEALPLEAFDLAAAQKKGILHAWQFGPLLVHDGQPNRTQAPGSFGIRHSRILFGYYEPGHYVAVAVDGRRKDAIGMNFDEMVDLMAELGCREAMNLDGGLSAIMTFMGETVNDPPKNGAGDGSGRSLADMLLFAEYDGEGSAPSLDTPDTKLSGN